MSMNANRFCSNCGSPADPGQRFCSNCGSAIDGATTNPNPTELKPGSSAPDLPTIPSQQENTPTYPSGSATPVPPPPPSQQENIPTYPSGSATPVPPPPPDLIQSVPPPPPDLIQPVPVANYQTPPDTYSTTQTSNQTTPDFARPQKRAGRRTGMCLLLIILVLVVIIGSVGATVYYLRGRNSATTGSNNNTSTGTTNTTATSTTNATVTTTTNANTVTFSPALSFIYADIKVSIQDVKQAPSFSDDTGIYGSPGVLRLDIKEESQTIDGSYYNYNSDSFTLVKADGTTIAKSTSLTGSGMNAGVSRTNWLDFTTNGTVDVSKLTLRVGTDSEAQMNIPLQNNADLSKYQPRSSPMNKQAMYGNLNWTITNVTMSYSALGSQAKKGMVYVVISSRLDNTSSSDYSFDSVGDNMRLQTGSTSAVSENNTLPGSVSPGQTGVTGNTTFEVPQGSTNFTCNLLKGNNGSQATSIQFQLQ